jgi:hypothetical protein
VSNWPELPIAAIQECCDDVDAERTDPATSSVDRTGQLLSASFVFQRCSASIRLSLCGTKRFGC